MKKVLAIVLALAMILGSFSFVAASSTDYNDVAGTKYEGAVAVLGALDIVSGYPDGTFKPEKVVTRAEMCKLIITALGLDDYVAGSYAAYPDVAGSHWATSYIAYATSLGVINGYPDGTFKPENPVTYQEAAAMLVRALGYQDQYLVGSWPASHVNVAMSEGILKGVTATAAGANRGDIALMVYNTLDCSMVQYNALGTLIAAGDMLTRAGAKKVEQVIFDEVKAHDAAKTFGIDLSAFVGAKVDYFWIDADKDNTYDATKGDAPVVIAKEYGTTLTGKYKAAVGADPATFVVGDTTYKFNADPNGAAVVDVYNGFTTNAAVTVAHDGTYTMNVKLNGIYIDEVYSTAQWVAASEIKWNEDYAAELADNNKIDSKAFTMTKADKIDYSWLTLVGVEDLATIAKDSIVTIYLSPANKVAKIGVATDVATGKITKIAGNPAVYTIGDAGYKASANAAFSPALGNEGTFFLNYKGELSFFKADSYAGNYAIVLAEPQQKTTYGSAGVWQIHLMTKDGEKAVYDFNKAETVAANLAAKDLVTFKTNADGQITAITEVTPTAATSLTGKGIMNGMLISDAAIIFDLTNNTEAPKNYKLGDLANLKTGADFTANDGVAFMVNAADGKIDCIVITTTTNTKAVTNIGIFTGKYDTYNAKNEEIYGGTLLINGAVADYTTVAKTSALDAAVVDRATFYKLSYKGADISAVVDAAGAAASAPQKESAFNASNEYFYYDLTADYAGLGGDLAEMNLVAKKVDATINLGTDATPDYQYVGAATTIYKVALKGDNTFDKLVLGSMNDVKKGAYVQLMQMDKTSGAWDTIIVLSADDYAKLTYVAP